jgi:hypothetical protein
MKRSVWGAAGLCLALMACGQDPAFTEQSIDGSLGTADGGTSDGSGPSDKSASSDGSGPSDRSASADAEGLKLKKFSFGKSVTPVVADYLFVLDNSVSMVKYAQKVANGLAAIPPSSFPESSKLAVMTTMVAENPLAASVVAHQDINRQDYTCIDREPGFLELVDAESVRRFRSCSGVRSDYVSKYAIETCEQKWFDPFAHNAAGQRCFSAALQNPFSPVGCEAGLLALEQILKRNAKKPLFRSSAAVNVIFVSDEQEGCKTPETRGQFSDATKLVQMIKANSGASSVKFHGVIPATVSDGIRKYATEINATGGIAIPIDQDRADYRDVIQKIIEAKSDITSSIFDLGEVAQGIVNVEVNGARINDFEFDGQRSVKIPNLDAAQPTQIVIQYY